ncbi:hypothetical protein ACTTAI_00080 (plasmid) [Rhodobacter capsulatus]|uniref:hypothetical protein n=1 Tax=Rhodobacter capsulatus TaxID=1061 RepID=UPI0040274981
MALNVYRIAMRDAMQLAFRIVLVMMFGLSWLNFSQIYDAASNGLGDLALAFFKKAGPVSGPRQLPRWTTWPT